MRLPRWRKATWALVAWCVLILIWAIAGGASNNCGDQATELNKSACQAGTGIGVAIILLLGFFGFLFFSLIWFMSRPKKVFHKEGYVAVISNLSVVSPTMGGHGGAVEI